MSIKKISKEQPENFEFNTKNIELAKKTTKRCYGIAISCSETK